MVQDKAVVDYVTNSDKNLPAPPVTNDFEYEFYVVLEMTSMPLHCQEKCLSMLEP